MTHLRRSPSLSFIRLPPSNLRPFGAPPSRGRREYPREPLPLEGAAEHSEAGLAFFFGGEAASSLSSPRGKGVVSRKAASSFRSLPHWGRGTASAVDRVLSLIVDLRRISSLSFIPPEPYPARFARHLPHAGKAVIRKSRFPHPTSAPSGHLLPEEGGSIHARRGWFPFSTAKPPPSFLISISHSCRAFARDQGTACPTHTTKGQTNETYCYASYDGGKNIDAAYRPFGSEAR